MPIFQPSMANNCWLSRARGWGGDAGSLTPRCSATLIRCMHWRILTETCVMLHVRTTTTTTTTTQPSHASVPSVLCNLFRVDGQRAARECCSSKKAATTALVVATRAAVDRCSPRHFSPPQLRPQGEDEGGGVRGQRGGRSETYYAPRGPKTLPPGTRPAPPSEVAGPLGPAATVGYVAAGAPLLAVSQELADEALGDKLDAEFDALMAIGPERLTSRQEARLRAIHQGRLDLIERRKRRRAARKSKKRRKKKLPRTRRLPRQWHVRKAGFAGCVAPRVMLPSYADRPKMLGILVGMDQKCSFHRARLRFGQWHMLGWFCWLLLALCSLLSLTGPRCSASCPLWTRRTFLLFPFPAVACAWLVLLVFYTSRCVPPVVVRLMMHHIMACMNEKDSYVARLWRTCLLCTTTGACGSHCRKIGFFVVVVH